MRARTAILELLKVEPGWRKFFKRCGETGALRLHSQAWQWRDELADRGQAFALVDVEYALMDLARKFFPGSPASEWDPEWAEGLCKDALTRLTEQHSGLSKQERDALDLSLQDSYEESMVAAGENNDPTAFRRSLKGWEMVGVAAIGEVRAGKGAA